MGCLFHKWDGCKCTKCGKIREVKYNWQHKWNNGCKCVNCGKLLDANHKWNHGKCEVCGKINEKEGHSDKRKYELDGENVKIYCKECGELIETRKYDELYDRYLDEIKNAEEAGCESPNAEAMICILKSLKNIE